MQLVFSVDLEPNKDGSLTGVREAMEWFDEVVPRGVAFVTHRIATELPEVVAMLADDHEIGVHVHPREFGHEHDQLAELAPERQRELIDKTSTELETIVDEPIQSFRAGRHSASEATFDVLADLGFDVDASVHVRYRDYLPASLTERRTPFELDNGMLEVPTTYIRPSLFSLPAIRVFPQRSVTATSTTLRVNSRGCSGLRAIRAIFDAVDTVSMYMHPYDSTDYHDELVNNGTEFRKRVEAILPDEDTRIVTLGELRA